MRFTAWSILSLVLLVAGIGFWLATGLSNGNWTDVGVYSIAIVLAGLGLFGLLASSRPTET